MAAKKHLVKEDEVTQAKRRTEIFRRLIIHLEGGYSLNCFEDLAKSTIDEWLVKYPEEFDINLYTKALRVGQLGWEDIGRQQSTGKCLGNSKAWVYNMINRFNWTDRTKIEQEVTGTTTINIVNYSDKPKGL